MTQAFGWLRLALFFVVLAGWGSLMGQSPASGQSAEDIAVRTAAVSQTIKGYNAQDFAQMKKPWFPLGQILVSRKGLRNEFAPVFQKLGAATIDTITYSSKYEYVAKVIFAKAPEKRAFLKYIFSEKGKIEGFGFTQPPLIYPKVRQPGPITAEKIRQIEALVETAHTKGGAAGMSGCVLASSDSAQVIRCTGYANMEQQAPLNKETIFDIASCSKQFTSMAVMILAERGKLSFADPFKKYFPDFPYPSITIEHLLTHTSGLPEYEGLLQKYWDASVLVTNRDILDLLQLHQPKVHFQANEHFEYNNTGYTLLALLIEAVSGQTYHEFLQREIFEPLGLRRTFVYNDRRSKGVVLDNFAYGYICQRSDDGSGAVVCSYPESLKAYEHVVYQEPIVGDGSIYSCVSDLALWIEALRTHRLVRKETMDLALTRHRLSSGSLTEYGYGYFLRDGEGTERVVFHTGGWPGYFSIVLWFQDHDEAVIVLNNNSYDDFLKLADGIVAILNQ